MALKTACGTNRASMTAAKSQNQPSPGRPTTSPLYGAFRSSSGSENHKSAAKLNASKERVVATDSDNAPRSFAPTRRRLRACFSPSNPNAGPLPTLGRPSRPPSAMAQINVIKIKKKIIFLRTFSTTDCKNHHLIPH